MAIRVAASKAMSAVGTGMAAVLTPRAPFSSGHFQSAATSRRAFINSLFESDLSDLTLRAFSGSNSGSDSSKDLLASSHNSFTIGMDKGKCPILYQASKEYLLTKAESQIKQPVGITGEELPTAIVIDGEKINWLYLSSDETDCAWFEFKGPSLPNEEFSHGCSELNPGLREQLLGCSNNISIVIHAAGGLKRKVLDHLFYSSAVYSSAINKKQMFLIHANELDDEFEGTAFKWRIHHAGSKVELSFKIDEKDEEMWKKVMELYLPHIMQHYRETSLS